jgi:hypothetical protein
MTSIEKIKNAFPNPIASNNIASDDPDTYCIGGALCQAAYPENPRKRFPSTYDVVDAILQFNSTISPHDAGEFAYYIIRFNDMNDMDRAWDVVEQALAFDPYAMHLRIRRRPAILGVAYFTKNNTPYWLEGIQKPHKPSSTGRVYVRDANGVRHEFFPNVIGLHWANREDQ